MKELYFTIVSELREYDIFVDFNRPEGVYNISITYTKKGFWRPFETVKEIENIPVKINPVNVAREEIEKYEFPEKYAMQIKQYGGIVPISENHSITRTVKDEVKFTDYQAGTEGVIEIEREEKIGGEYEPAEEKAN